MAGTTITIRQLINSCRQFCMDNRGMSLPMVALILVPVLGFIGLSVDAGRGYMIKSRLGDALDAAALAGAQVVHDQAQFATTSTCSSMPISLTGSLARARP